MNSLDAFLRHTSGIPEIRIIRIDTLEKSGQYAIHYILEEDVNWRVTHMIPICDLTIDFKRK